MHNDKKTSKSVLLYVMHYIHIYIICTMIKRHQSLFYCMSCIIYIYIYYMHNDKKTSKCVLYASSSHSPSSEFITLPTLKKMIQAFLKMECTHGLPEGWMDILSFPSNENLLWMIMDFCEIGKINVGSIEIV